MATKNSATNQSIDTAMIRIRENEIASRINWRRLAEPSALVTTLLALIVIFSILNPRFASVENLRNLMDQAALPLIVAVGATLVILLGSIDLSIEGIMGSAGLTFVLLSANTRGDSDFGLLALLAALTTGIIFGLINGLIVTKVKVPSFVVTLGMWFVGLGFATVLYGTESIPFLTNPAISSWSSTLNFGIPNSFWAAIAVVVLGLVTLVLTKTGRSIMAIGNNEVIARNSGMRVDRIKITVFAIAGALSALAGIIAAIKLGSGSPSVGLGTLFITIPAVVIGGTALAGGKGGVLRTTLGVLLLTVLNNGLILAGVSPSFQSGIAGAILIAAIVFAAWSQRDRLRIAK
jgi:ribose transport system permease protein